ncbi:hypothetical protein B0H16DRAFT_1731470 [Mycena metata]|uniref:Uncharacterized protein n=1 Tax=Mycena metata TaxID=1033252 RepID=A0AAD7I559_9AGAR|nr:hypothetical protein B0H16DRAFT_1731470 [Mycena metata]
MDSPRTPRWTLSLSSDVRFTSRNDFHVDRRDLSSRSTASPLLCGFSLGAIRKWALEAGEGLAVASGTFPNARRPDMGIVSSRRYQARGSGSRATHGRIRLDLRLRMRASKPPRRPSQPTPSHPIVLPLGLPELQPLVLARLVAGSSEDVSFSESYMLPRLLAYKYPKRMMECMSHISRIAGADTTAISLSYFLWELTRRQNEIDARALSPTSMVWSTLTRGSASVRRPYMIYPHPNLAGFDLGVHTRSRPRRSSPALAALAPPGSRRMDGGGEAEEAEEAEADGDPHDALRDGLAHPRWRPFRLRPASTSGGEGSASGAGAESVTPDAGDTPARGRKARPVIFTSTPASASSSATPAPAPASTTTPPETGSASPVYIYSRANFARPPVAQLPGHKRASVVVQVSLVLYELRAGVQGGGASPSHAENQLGGGGEPRMGTGTARGAEGEWERSRDAEESMEVGPLASSSSSSAGTGGSTLAVPAPQQHASFNCACFARAPTRGPAPRLSSTPALTGSVFALPYRMLYAVVTMDTVTIYDTQQAGLVCLLTKPHYDEFTDLTCVDGDRERDIGIDSIDAHASRCARITTSLFACITKRPPLAAPSPSEIDVK